MEAGKKRQIALRHGKGTKIRVLRVPRWLF